MIFDVYFANEEMDETKKPIYMYPFNNTKNTNASLINKFEEVPF